MSLVGQDIRIDRIRREDVQAIVELDAVHTGKDKSEWWQKRLEPLFSARGDELTIGYVARFEEQVIGYILAEGRAWEFGSPLCGWIVAIGVHPQHSRQGVALNLTRKVCRKFRDLGIDTVRTMVRKDDVQVLSFFRASGFHAGPFIELELEL
ncbi:MAG TPA: GNAT family N-acetyltransferase [Bacteroidetes bacterium]|nr:GNAT family N-acetyltransferase [Bacteroidota bacterium]